MGLADRWLYSALDDRVDPTVEGVDEERALGVPGVVGAKMSTAIGRPSPDSARSPDGGHLSVRAQRTATVPE